MDVAYIRALNVKDKEEEAKREPSPPEELSSRPLSPALFDALFGNNDNVRSA
jgi:hypothetical protein